LTRATFKAKPSQPVKKISVRTEGISARVQ
jgi:hypothetical protein